MAKRQKEWARRKRAELTKTLGGECAHCGATEKLEFDCIIPQGDEHHKLDTERRIMFYTRQHEAGNVQLLCADCHGKKTARDARKHRLGLLEMAFTRKLDFNNVPF